MGDAGTRAMIMRGGSSKGAYFVKSDLPADEATRNRLLLEIMGSPDERQIDGMGGAHPLTSKVAIVAVSDRDDADVDYLFLQVSVDEPLVSDRQNCGNLLAGVAPFAIERGLITIDASVSKAQVSVHMLNTDSVAIATISVSDGQPVYGGTTAISGVPGTAAGVQLDFEDIAGGSTGGAMLPTGNLIDSVTGVDCTLIDNGMPVIVVRADAVGITGYESPTELEANQSLRAQIEALRLAAGPLMRLGDVGDTTVPKITMVAPPVAGGALCTRTFIPHRCHQAIGVLGAVSVATAALLPGTTANSLLQRGTPGSVVLEHPTGTFEALITLDGDSVERAGIIRTARKLMDGHVFARTV